MIAAAIDEGGPFAVPNQLFAVEGASSSALAAAALAAAAAAAAAATAGWVLASTPEPLVFERGLESTLAVAAGGVAARVSVHPGETTYFELPRIDMGVDEDVVGGGGDNIGRARDVEGNTVHGARGDGVDGEGGGEGDAPPAVSFGDLYWVMEIVGLPSAGQLHLLSPGDAFVTAAGGGSAAVPPLGPPVLGTLALTVPVTAGSVRFAYVAPPSSASPSRRLPSVGAVVLFRTCPHVAMKSGGMQTRPPPGGECGTLLPLRATLTESPLPPPPPALAVAATAVAVAEAEDMVMGAEAGTLNPKP